MTIIIVIMLCTLKGMCLSTLAVGQAQSGLSRAAQRTLLLPTRTSLRSSLSHVLWATGRSFSLIQHTSHWSLVTAQTCSIEPVHVCLRPRDIHRGCGGKAPKKRLTPLIFIRLYTRSLRWRSRPFFKLGASNSGLKLSIHMAYQKTNSRSTGEKSPIQPRLGQSDGLARWARKSRSALELVQDLPYHHHQSTYPSSSITLVNWVVFSSFGKLNSDIFCLFWKSNATSGSKVTDYRKSVRRAP